MGLRSLLAVLAVTLLAACGPGVNVGGGGGAPVFSPSPATSGLNLPRPDRPLVDEFGRQLAPGAARVALLLPLTGDTGQLGQQMLNAAEMALFEVASRDFELIPVDTGGTPDGARIAAQTAVQQGAELILGPLFSGSVRPAAQVAAPYNVNLVAFTTDANTAGGNAFVMGILPQAQVERVMAFGANRGVRSYAVLAPDTTYGQLIALAMQQSGPRFGANVAVTQFYPQDADDYGQYVEAIQGSSGSFEAIMLPDVGLRLRQVAPLIPYYYMRGEQIVGTGLWDGAGVEIEPALHGAWYAAPPPGLRRDFEARYERDYGVAPPRLATLAYDAVALAASLAQNTMPGRFGRQALTDPSGFSGLDGIFRFGQGGLVERGLAVLQVTPEGAEVIDPAPSGFAGGPIF